MYGKLREEQPTHYPTISQRVSLTRLVLEQLRLIGWHARLRQFERRQDNLLQIEADVEVRSVWLL